MIDPSQPGEEQVAPHSTTRYYDIHGLTLAVSGTHQACAALHERLQHFAVVAAKAPELHVELAASRPDSAGVDSAVPTRARPVYESPLGRVMYDDMGDRLFIVHEELVKVICDPADGVTRIIMLEETSDQSWLSSHPFFTIPFIECLKRRDRYNLHASGVCVDAKAILFPARVALENRRLQLAWRA